MRLKRSTAVGLLAILLGINMVGFGWSGSWGVAYGQSAGPTPTLPTNISPISAEKSVNPSNGEPGDSLTFSIDIRNNETSAQTNVTLSDRIPDFLEIISVNTTKGTASFSGQNVSVNIGTLEPGEVVTVTIVVRIRQSASDGDTGINVAEVSSTEGGSTVTTPTNPVAISVNQPPPAQLPPTGASSRPVWLGWLGLALCAVGLFSVLRQRQQQHEG